MKDTAEQQAALAIDRHLAITANAGSGKTRVLVKRFYNLLNKLSINNSVNYLKTDTTSLVAITFTRKAASEMQYKIISLVDNEIEEIKKNMLRNGLDKYDSLKRIRAGLSYSKITTIHSFCTDLISKYPVEAKIPVSFFNLNESELKNLFHESYLNIIEDWLESDDERKSKAEYLINQFSLTELEEIVTKLLRNSELIPVLSNLFDGDIMQLHDKTVEYIKGIFTGIIYPQFVAAYSYINFDSITDYSTKKITSGELIKYLNELSLVDLDDLNSQKISELISKMNLIYTQLIGTESYSVRKNFTKKYSFDFDESYLENILGNFSTHFELIDSLKYYEENLDYLKLSKELLGFLQEVFELVNEEKLNLGGLDFNDLQLKAVELLKNYPEIAERERSKINYLMIDEFQDTNSLQYSLVKLLIPSLDFDFIDTDHTNLFIVGDEKQSIYKFRNANVKIFNIIKDEIANRNQLNKSSDNGIQNLSATFRLLPAISAFVNQVCGELFTAKNDYEVNYNNLICSRYYDNFSVLNEINTLDNDDNGSIDFLLVDTNENITNEVETEEDLNESQTEESSDETVSESKLICDYIIDIVNNREIYTEDAVDKSNRRKIKYSDIGILSRKKSNFNKLTKECIRRNIPFQLHSGLGFYNQPEINDILSILKFAYNSSDSASLIAALRSPFFNLSDEIILTFSSIDDRSVWENIKELATQEDNSDYLLIKDIYDKLEEITTNILSMPISFALIYLFETTDYYSKIILSDRREQIENNLNKLISIGREFESNGFRNLFDFIEYVDSNAVNQSSESEAQINYTENSINILTVHSAKGLEFPVVILYNTNFSMGNDRFLINEDYGLYFKYQKKNENLENEDIKTPTKLLIRYLDKLAINAEENRILYVALTRAKDRLVVSCNYKSKLNKANEIIYEKPKGFLKNILLGLNLDFEEFLEKNEINRKINLSMEINSIKKQVPLNLNIKLIRGIEQKSDSVLLKYNQLEKRLDLDYSLSTIHINEQFSPTGLMKYNDDELRYVKENILHLPQLEIKSSNKSNNSEKSDETSGPLAGTIIHSVLQELKSWFGENGVINFDIFDSIINENLKYYPEINTSLMQHRVVFECGNVVSTNLLQEYKHLLKKSFFEYSLLMPLGTDVFNVKIDLLVLNNDGFYEIWDWKTNQISTEDDKKHLISYYEFQMKSYAFMISKLYPKQDYYKSRLLFTRLVSNSANDVDWVHTFNWSLAELKDFEQTLIENVSTLRKNVFIWN